MAWSRNKVFFCLSYIPALIGLSRYYFDYRSGQLKTSRFLKYYSIVINLLIFCGLPFSFYIEVKHKTVVNIKTNLQQLLRIEAISENVFMILTIVYTTQRRHYQMVEIAAKIQRIRKSLGMCRNTKCFYLYFNLAIIVFYFLVLNALELVFIKIQSILEQIFVGVKIIGHSLLLVIYMLGFSMFWKTWKGCCHLQHCLNRVLTQPQRHRSTLYKELSRLLSLQQQLIELTVDLCNIFNHILAFILMRAAWHSIICGYFAIRLNLSNNCHRFQLAAHLLMPVCMFSSLSLMYSMGNLAEALGRSLQETTFTLRQSHQQDTLMERSIIWHILHFSSQNAEIRICGGIPIKRSFVFTIVGSVMLYVICMIQEDYRYLKN
ncbi:hypothetical protein KR044_004478 [Drosophila immigrans]|nr:hypothetical protein KR044_004478 [Drosophila immigrans]